MAQFDVFNGDADGICALHQWRLAYPSKSTLITGVKRDIGLLARVQAAHGDEVLVLDVSMDSNRTDLERLLNGGAEVRYFDHHYAGDQLQHVGLQATIDTEADQCTSLLVDRAITGRFREWAVVAAFGDNLFQSARRAAEPLDLDENGLSSLEKLGELLNYNAYGDSVEDLHFAPDDLYRQIAPYSSPFDFIQEGEVFGRLLSGFTEDISNMETSSPCLNTPAVGAWLLPDSAWSRRVVGVASNRLASANPTRAHALLVPNKSGSLTVSVRAPKAAPAGADEFCRRYPTGGGRKAAAGINHLPANAIDAFLGDFSDFFSRR